MGELIISFFKLLFAIFLLPLVISCSLEIKNFFITYSGTDKEFFLWGLLAFLITFIFVHPFRGFHEFGQRMISGLLKVIAPLDQVVANIIPFFTLVIVIVYWVVDHFFKLNQYSHYFVFFAGFTFCMHVILVAQILQEQEKSILKPNYFWSMALYFVLNVFIIVLLLDLIIGQFTFSTFFKSMISNAWDLYVDVYNKIMSLMVKGKVK